MGQILGTDLSQDLGTDLGQILGTVLGLVEVFWMFCPDKDESLLATVNNIPLPRSLQAHQLQWLGHQLLGPDSSVSAFGSHPTASGGQGESG